MDAEGIPAFMPIFPTVKKYSAKPVGMTIDVKITEYDRKSKKNVVVSNKIVEKEKK